MRSSSEWSHAISMTNYALAIGNFLKEKDQKRGLLLPKQRLKLKLKPMQGGTSGKAIVISGSEKAPAPEAMPVDLNMTKPEREPEEGPDHQIKKGQGIDPTVLPQAELRAEARAPQAKAIDLPVFSIERASVKRGTNVTFGILQYATDLRRVRARWATDAHSFIKVLSLQLRSPFQKQRQSPRSIVRVEELPYRWGLWQLERRVEFLSQKSR